MSVQCVFFDIGGTLGARDAATGKLHAFPDSAEMLSAIRNVVRLRIGVITTLGPLSNNDGWALLEQAGLARFIDAQAFVSEHDVNEIAKPHRNIYDFAAQRVGVAAENCLFIGENLVEVVGALAAGMQALLKPSPLSG